MRKFLLFFGLMMILCWGCFALETTPEVIVPTVEARTIAVTVEAKTITATVEKPLPKTEVSYGTKKFSDVPDDHWAASSVYDLVNLGVTQGYPDGTFRGNNNITRYETAMFLSKLANAIGQSGDRTDMAIEKVRDDLRAEIRSLRAEIAELKRMPEEEEEKPFSGSYSTSIMFGNLITRNTSIEGEYAPIGPLYRYRLMTSFSKKVTGNAKVKVNIDTMDSGFGGGSSNLSTKILDVEGAMKLDLGLEAPVDVKVTSGPGPVVHTEEADASGNYIARSENNVVYVRPYNSIMFSSKLFGMGTSVGYMARRLSAFGEVEVNQIKVVLDYNFPGALFLPSFKLNTNVDQLFSKPQADPAGPSDTKYTFDFAFTPSQKLKTDLIYSFGEGEAPHNSMFGLEVNSMDVWETGTTFRVKYTKVGTDYLYENDALSEDLFAGLDVFNRYIGNGNGAGVVDIWGEVTQVVTENFRFLSRADWRLAPDNSYDSDYPQCSLMIDGGFDWDIATDTLLEVLYCVESIPSAADPSTDLTKVNLSFKF